MEKEQAPGADDARTGLPDEAGDPGPSGPRRVLLLFLDGVGIGDADPERNPFFRAGLPALRGLLGGELPSLEAPSPIVRGHGQPESSAGTPPWAGGGPAGGSPGGLPEAAAFPLDAALDVEGTPQSGTGQTALLTGRNAPRIFGRHFGPWTPVRLRPLLEEENLLSRAREAGLEAAFANAYPEGYPGSRSSRSVAAPPLAARAAGLLVRHAAALARGEAVASEIVNEGWRRHLGHHDLPQVTPRDAGEVLARIAADHRLTLYAHYATDLAGHRGGMAGAVEALERVDAFLGGVLAARPRDLLLLVASDHGNVEDVDAEHTRNPALGLAVGPGAHALAVRLRTIADVAGAVLKLLGPGGA